MLPFPAYRLDEMRARAGAATHRAFGGVQKRYAKAVGVSKSTAARHFTGENSPTTRFLYQIASADKATAWPILAEAIATVRQVDIEKATTNELEAQRLILTDAEHGAEADADRCSVRAMANPSPDNLTAAADAHVKVAEISLELAATLREIAERKRRG